LAAVLVVAAVGLEAAGVSLPDPLWRMRNQTMRKMIPSWISAAMTRSKIARGLLVTQSRASLAQHPSGLGTLRLSPSAINQFRYVKIINPNSVGIDKYSLLLQAQNVLISCIIAKLKCCNRLNIIFLED
jgi:hypothetical protein